MKITGRLLYLFTSLLALCSCSSVDILNFTIPSSGYSVHKDIAYGSDPRQQLDIYVPDKPEASKSVIVFFYGGSWQMGTRDDYKFVGQAFASKGFITVIADYRLYPQVYFPAFLEDSANAFVWAHKHISEYGGNPDKLFLAGHSAGGYNAVMLTVNDSYIKGAGGDRSWVKGAIGIAGPYDFLPFSDPKIKEIFSKAKDPDTQPITFVGPNLPPMLLLQGTTDTEVGADNTINLAAKLRQFNDPVTERLYPDIGHIGIALALARGFRGKAPVLADVTAFIHANTSPLPTSASSSPRR